MGFFNRGQQDAAPLPVAENHGRGRRHHHHSAEPYTMSSRPTFGQWVKGTWLDILTMAVLGAIGLGVYYAPPAPSRSFAVEFAHGEVVHPQFAYPSRKEIIPIWLAAFLASVVPIFIMLCMQFRIRSFWDFNNAVVGLLYSLITAAVFQVFIKWLIGGLRPHFLAVCKPDISKLTGGNGSGGFDGLYYTREICTGDAKEINDALESMPSGHATAAFAGLVFLYLYLNAKLKVFSNYHPSMWKLAVTYMPLLGACLVAGALTVDEFHHWYDLLAGATIGTVMAFSAYRMTYAAVWDWRYNHIPLHRNAPFMYARDWDLGGPTFTRKAGWGGHEHGSSGGSSGVHGNGASTNGRGQNAHAMAAVGSGAGMPRAHGVRGDNMV
ncbi:putative lipid phosphate phosphatase 1 [Trichocladium antarcticum]|uniref:Lipid phosphate phosphatase 1 n=1 Tax=Trichocladium antarcticum TaxID=1450529 RepID=A0AAN6ZDD2_9PEZI|nr:putative lipid phosphate phosphatase 1 [Trichocladium antarcticum]